MIMAFQFRQFSVEDEHSSMKVGTDGVLIGAWANHNNPQNILDIGTGSGLIALMMAQRFPQAAIYAIDIHNESVKEAENNFAKSPWVERLSLSIISLQEYATESKTKYDLIVSNPPFFNNSLQPPIETRKQARHTATLTYPEIADSIANILHPEGNFCLILPAKNQAYFEQCIGKTGLVKTKQLSIIPVSGKTPNRILSEWGFGHSSLEESTLLIRNNEGFYSEEYKDLTKEFYLAL